MKHIKEGIAALVLAFGVAGCTSSGRQPDQKENLRNYERTHRFDSMYNKPNYMPSAPRYNKK
jgi:hypothetical protein